MLKYNNYAYIWPPRPEVAISDSLLQHYQNQGWIAQVKKNGTCTVVFASPDRVIFKNRHNEDHKAWQPKPKHINFFKNLAKDGWCVFTCELLHSKGSVNKDTLYIFDIVVWKGEYLTGTTFQQRQELLREIFNVDVDVEDHVEISDGVWLAMPIKSNWQEYWKNHDSIEDEGLVLKNPNAKMVLCNKPSSNSGWQVKCRHTHKNFSF